MSLEKCSKFLSLSKGLRKLKSLTSTPLSEPDTLSASLLLSHLLLFRRDCFYFSSSVCCSIKNAPPEIELYLSNFRGALHKNPWTVLFLKPDTKYQCRTNFTPSSNSGCNFTS